MPEIEGITVGSTGSNSEQVIAVSGDLHDPRRRSISMLIVVAAGPSTVLHIFCTEQCTLIHGHLRSLPLTLGLQPLVSRQRWVEERIPTRIESTLYSLVSPYMARSDCLPVPLEASKHTAKKSHEPSCDQSHPILKMRSKRLGLKH